MSGDRSFFTHDKGSNARGLGKNTKNAVLARTLLHSICDNAKADQTQRNVFKLSSGSNPDEDCKLLTDLDYPGIVQDILGTC